MTETIDSEARDVTQELVTLAQSAAAEIEPFADQLAAFRERYDGVVYDLDDPAQNKRARSDKLAVGKVVAKLDRRHADLKAPLLEATRLLDGRRKEIKDGLLEVQGGIKAQLEEHSKREEARVDALRERLQELESLGCGLEAMTAADLGSRLKLLVDSGIGDDWEEFEAAAALAKMRATERVEDALAKRHVYEAEQAELARLRAEAEAREREAREERIRAAAEAKAKAEAEEAIQAERRRAEQAEAKAKAEAEAAQARAQREAVEHAAAIARAAEQARAAEAARIAQEVAEENERAEAEARAEEQRRAKAKHRSRIHGEAKNALLAVADWLTEEQAVALVETIRDGRIDHVSITY